MLLRDVPFLDFLQNLIVEALQLAARGVVLKDSVTQLLLRSIHTVMMGEYWVGREVVANPVQCLRKHMQASHEKSRQKKFGLAPRELEVVSAVLAFPLNSGSATASLNEQFG
jgi:two-component system, NarL family, nitrate/nitrite response regulator NarL